MFSFVEKHLSWYRNKSLSLCYILAALGLCTPFSGLHRFYLGKPISGFLYLVTFGFFSLGTIWDLVTMPMLYALNTISLPRHNNIHFHVNNASYSSAQGASYTSNSSAENKILRLAKRHDGKLTVQMVALETNLSLKQAKKELDKLLEGKYCDIDVDEYGSVVYIFRGLKTGDPIF